VLATDERHDLAILKVNGYALPILELGNSDSLRVGEPLVVVGSPRGLQGTVTARILSSVRDLGDGFEVLQTDVSINPGNSGGPLVNDKGHAIGVVSFQLRSAQGLNFAIPTNFVRVLLSSIHKPITLDQMRKTLRVDTLPDTSLKTILGLSLPDTLSWLKETILHARMEYTLEKPFEGHQVITTWNIRSRAWSFQSCTVTLGSEAITTTQNCSRSCRDTIINQFTIPLASVERVSVELKSNANEAPGGKILAGAEWAYRVLLEAQSDIHYSMYVEGGPMLEHQSRAVNLVEFVDEATAQRTAVAFRHAADLCRRGPKPF